MVGAEVEVGDGHVWAPEETTAWKRILQFRFLVGGAGTGLHGVWLGKYGILMIRSRYCIQ